MNVRVLRVKPDEREKIARMSEVNGRIAFKMDRKRKENYEWTKPIAENLIKYSKKNMHINHIELYEFIIINYN